MKWGVDWSQNSTKRGAIWILVALLGTVGWWMGKDVTQLLMLGMGVAGGIGVALRD